MKDKKSLLVIIVAAIVVVFMIAAVVVVLKDSNHNSGEENNSSSENETTSENITEETKEETVEDLYQKFEEYYTEKDYAKALNYGYLFLDKSEDAQLRENVFVKIADIYVEHQNYDAAGMLLKESQIEGLYDKYCNETFDLTVYEGAYQDSENEDYFYLGSYPQTRYAIDEVPEYVANADVDAKGYVEVYGVKYIRIDDVFYAYEPVKWWIIGTEGSGYCCLSECIIDTKSFDTAFGPIT